MPTGIYKRKPLSEETKNKISNAKKGHIVSRETRDKIGRANKGNPSPIWSKDWVDCYKLIN